MNKNKNTAHNRGVAPEDAKKAAVQDANVKLVEEAMLELASRKKPFKIDRQKALDLGLEYLRRWPKTRSVATMAWALATPKKWVGLPDKPKQSGSLAVVEEDLLSRITIDPNVCHGKPCIRGHRIWVSLILDFLAGGVTIEELLDDYPGIEEADIRACIAYGAEMARGNFVDVVLGKDD